jgi:hypothetical protein
MATAVMNQERDTQIRADPLRKLQRAVDKYIQNLESLWENRPNKPQKWDERTCLGQYGPARIASCYDKVKALVSFPDRITADEYQFLKSEIASYLCGPERRRYELLVERLERAVPKPEWKKAEGKPRPVKELADAYRMSIEPPDFSPPGEPDDETVVLENDGPTVA